MNVDGDETQLTIIEQEDSTGLVSISLWHDHYSSTIIHSTLINELEWQVGNIHKSVAQEIKWTNIDKYKWLHILKIAYHSSFFSLLKR